MEALQQLHLSLTQNIKNSFDTAYTGLNAELVAYNARVKDAEDRAQKSDEARQRAVAKVNKLRHEISLLQEQLQQDEANAKDAEKAAESALRLDETYEPGRVLGNKEFSALDALDVRRISDRYTELYQQAAIIVQASRNLRDLVKRHKTKVARLKALLRRQRPTSVLDEKALKPRRDSTGPVNLLESPELPGSAINPLKDPVRAKVPSGSTLTPTFGMVREQSSSIMRDACSSASESRLQEGHPEWISTPSDASTDELPPIGGASSNVEVETLKRKRAAPDQTDSKGNSSSKNLGKGDPTHPILVKSETLSSSPLMTHSPQPEPSGTQDLDDIGDTVVTPTKRIRPYRDQGYNITSENPPTTLKLASARHTPLRNHTVRAGKDASSVLRPVDGNLRSPSAGQVANKKRTKNLGAITRISSLTEDGDETRPLSWRRGIKSPQSDTNARDPSRVHRLLNLLEGASPTSRTLQCRVTTNASAVTTSCTPHISGRGSPRRTTVGETGATSITIPAISDFLHCSPQTREPDKDLDHLQHQSGRMSQTEAVLDHKPYRARPPHRLSIEHFRINPEYNNGLDYAYDEVVRKRDERKYASGCTRPGCCGENFSAMARFGIPLDAFSPEIRDNLLVEAKTRVFANQFGKHRHQHHRSGTPPGFWRTEMPGTQELEGDREEARRLEREKVQERYREAMRPGGLWRFADE
ncbi:hypothetical protein BDW71DRAFT_180747 [Aspergillus fruticulosus]